MPSKTFLPSSSKISCPEGHEGENFGTQDKDMDLKDCRSTNIKKVSSDSKNYLLKDDDVLVEENFTPDNQSCIESDSALFFFVEIQMIYVTN